MAWETALDRLLIQQIHLAEKGELRAEDLRASLIELHRMAPERPGTSFLLGYARVLAGLDLPEARPGTTARWQMFGRLRAHDRRGERSWIADLATDPCAMLDLLREPSIAQQCLPLVMRTLFWAGDLMRAVQTIGFLAASESDPADSSGEDLRMMVDACLTDLLARIEHQGGGDRPADRGPMLMILARILELPCFARLPVEVCARYHAELGRHHLLVSDFDRAATSLARALVLAPEGGRTWGRVLALSMLAELRLHSVDQLEPRERRPERAAALALLQGVDAAARVTMPEASFCQGILSYETGDHELAVQALDAALDGLRSQGRTESGLTKRVSFFLAAAILASGRKEDLAKALHLMDQALDVVRPDLESFYPVHEALKSHDRRLALKFLDAVDVGRGTAPDQLLFIALEYLSLAEAEPAAKAAQRVLHVAVDLDQRIEAMRTLLSAYNMQGNRPQARVVYEEIRELLLQRGKFVELETLLKNEAFVGQALDHVDIKCELVALYEEMEDREYERATLQTAIARSLRARKDVEQLREAHAILSEVSMNFPDLAREDLVALEKLLEQDTPCSDLSAGAELTAAATRSLGHTPKVLVVGGNERQRRHHARFAEIASSWKFDGEWLMANYTSPQKVVAAVNDRLENGLDLLILLHWNRHETTEPALELARRHGLMARTVHYAGFTSLQVALQDMMGRAGAGKGAAQGAKEKLGTR